MGVTWGSPLVCLPCVDDNLLSLSEVVTLCPTNLFIVLDDSLGAQSISSIVTCYTRREVYSQFLVGALGLGGTRVGKIWTWYGLYLRWDVSWCGCWTQTHARHALWAEGICGLRGSAHLGALVDGVHLGWNRIGSGLQRLHGLADGCGFRTERTSSGSEV